MKVNVTAKLEGKEIADSIVDEIKKTHGIVINDGTYTVKCIVLNKKDEPVEIPLDKVSFVFNRE